MSKIVSGILLNTVDYMLKGDEEKEVYQVSVDTDSLVMSISSELIKIVLKKILLEGLPSTSRQGYKIIGCPIDKTGESCPICMDKYTKNCRVCLTNCGHYFCNTCLEKWLKEKNNCPMCRADL